LQTASFRSERLQFFPLQARFLRPYQESFTEEIARYQLADAFTHIRDAADYFHRCYEREQIGLSCVRLLADDSNRFVGSIEADGLWGDAPALGIWIAKEHQGQGYAEEALSRFLSVLREYGYSHFRYETDKRNLASIRLVQKFRGEPDTEETVESSSGKQLQLVLYRIH